MVSSSDLSSLTISREAGSASHASPRRRALHALGVVGIAVLVAGAVVLAGERAIEVRTATAELRGGATGRSGLTANGYVVARTKASVSSKVPGRLVFLGVEEGDRVEAGTVLARLEAAEYEAAVHRAESEVLGAQATHHEAEAELARARRDLERARVLRRDSLVSEQTLQDAVTGVEVAEARLRAAAARIAAAQATQAAARAALDNTVIRAPFAGTILRKDAELGEVVAPAVAGGGLTRGAVVTMADLSTLEVEVDVNEAYIASVRDDQPADIVLDAYPRETFAGHVRQIVPTADRQTATVLVRVAIDDADDRILPQMGARVVFREPESDPAAAEAMPARVYAPAAAVQNDAGQDVVWLVVDGLAQRREVEAGPVMGDEREVRSGLSGGELLIVDPPEGLTEGTPVEPAPGT